jgi:apyrase
MGANGQLYQVYVHSYLTYGLMMGRGAILAHPESKSCLPQGMTGVYKSPYGGMEYTTVADPAGGDAEKCAKVAEGVLEVGKACKVEPVSECSFAGAWGGGGGHLEQPFYVMSYFFDRCASITALCGRSVRHVRCSCARGPRAPVKRVP